MPEHYCTRDLSKLEEEESEEEEKEESNEEEEEAEEEKLKTEEEEDGDNDVTMERGCASFAHSGMFSDEDSSSGLLHGDSVTEVKEEAVEYQDRQAEDSSAAQALEDSFAAQALEELEFSKGSGFSLSRHERAASPVKSEHDVVYSPLPFSQVCSPSREPTPERTKLKRTPSLAVVSVSSPASMSEKERWKDEGRREHFPSSVSEREGDRKHRHSPVVSRTFSPVPSIEHRKEQLQRERSRSPIIFRLPSPAPFKEERRERSLSPAPREPTPERKKDKKMDKKREWTASPIIVRLPSPAPVKEEPRGHSPTPVSREPTPERKKEKKKDKKRERTASPIVVRLPSPAPIKEELREQSPSPASREPSPESKKDKKKDKKKERTASPIVVKLPSPAPVKEERVEFTPSPPPREPSPERKRDKKKDKKREGITLSIRMKSPERVKEEGRVRMPSPAARAPTPEEIDEQGDRTLGRAGERSVDRKRSGSEERKREGSPEIKEEVTEREHVPDRKEKRLPSTSSPVRERSSSSEEMQSVASAPESPKPLPCEPVSKPEPLRTMKLVIRAAGGVHNYQVVASPESSSRRRRSHSGEGHSPRRKDKKKKKKKHRGEDKEREREKDAQNASLNSAKYSRDVSVTLERLSDKTSQEYGVYLKKTGMDNGTASAQSKSPDNEEEEDTSEHRNSHHHHHHHHRHKSSHKSKYKRKRKSERDSDGSRHSKQSRYFDDNGDNSMNSFHSGGHWAVVPEEGEEWEIQGGEDSRTWEKGDASREKTVPRWESKMENCVKSDEAFSKTRLTWPADSAHVSHSFSTSSSQHAFRPSSAEGARANKDGSQKRRFSWDSDGCKDWATKERRDSLEKVKKKPSSSSEFSSLVRESVHQRSAQKGKDSGSQPLAGRNLSGQTKAPRMFDSSPLGPEEGDSSFERDAERDLVNSQMQSAISSVLNSSVLNSSGSSTEHNAQHKDSELPHLGNSSYSHDEHEQSNTEGDMSHENVDAV
jgi:hypothetical protein